jgi:hypothetical protein
MMDQIVTRTNLPNRNSARVHFPSSLLVLAVMPAFPEASIRVIDAREPTEGLGVESSGKVQEMDRTELAWSTSAPGAARTRRVLPHERFHL